MLDNAASAGQMLVQENDKLLKDIESLKKQLKEQEDEIETFKKLSTDYYTETMKQ